jgi:hypothetical protein
MISLYRAVSQQEKDDYDNQQIFRTGKNTLEAKQFFKSRIAIKEFVAGSVLQNYDPPYAWLLIITINEDCFDETGHMEMRLDGYDAINIEEDHLPEFNNCVKFVKQESL